MFAEKLAAELDADVDDIQDNIYDEDMKTPSGVPYYFYYDSETASTNYMGVIGGKPTAIVYTDHGGSGDDNEIEMSVNDRVRYVIKYGDPEQGATLNAIMPAKMVKGFPVAPRKVIAQTKPGQDWQAMIGLGLDILWNRMQHKFLETADVTDYNPPSQGGTRRELVAKYHQTKDPKDAEAARRAGATQQELQGVAEGKWFRTTYGWAGGEKPGGGKYKHPETVAAERRAKLAAKKKAEQAAKFGKSDAEPGVAEEGYRSRHAWLNHGVTTKWPSAKIRRVKINGQRIDQALVHNVVVGEWNLASKTGFVNSPANTPELAEQQAGNAAFSPEEIAAINQYLDDEISFIQLRRGYPGVISKAAQQFGIGPVRGFVGEIGFYDRMLQARDEGDIPKQGVAEGDKQTPGIALSKAYEKDFTGKYPGGTLPAATKGKTPGIALSKAYKKDFTGKYPGGELEEGFGRYNITIPSNLLRKIQKIFPKDSVRDIGEWYASAEEYGQPLTVKEYANWRKQGVAEGEYDHSELYNGCYVRDEQDGANGEVFRMSGDPEDRRVRIEDKDGRGWYISPHRLQLVDENDPAVARWFGNSRDEDDLAEGDNLATFVGPNEDSTDVMDHRGAVTDSFTEDLARIKTLALSK
mgnify:CR=1 FL=1